MSRVSFKPVSENSAATSGAAPEIVPPSAIVPVASAEIVPQARPVDDDDDSSPSEIRYPYLNLVQPTSKSPLKEFGIGAFVLKQDVKLPPKFRAVVVEFSPARFIEKLEYGKGGKPRIFSNSTEVADVGGTTIWRDSVENRKGSSRKPLFQPTRTCFLLIELPEGVDDSRFFLVIDGKHYAPCMFIVKSTSYESFFVTLNSEKKTGILRDGFASRFIEVSSQKLENSEAFKPIVRVLEKTPQAVVEEAAKLASK